MSRTSIVVRAATLRALVRAISGRELSVRRQVLTVDFPSAAMTPSSFMPVWLTVMFVSCVCLSAVRTEKVTITGLNEIPDALHLST